jgi:asparagine synthase (glutamine-hydrolysing)
MCGISGIVSARAAERIGPVEAMIRAQSHRGPDDSGHWHDANCVLGHNRLSIVDLGGGHQPMHDADGRYSIVFNGEIYGYKDLRRETPFDYRTESDTEVILALYARHGASFIKRLPGMFAFALWDHGRKSLFAARDRFGEKPFFYALTQQGELLFASELKSIVASGLVEPRIDPASMVHYLNKGYVDPARSIYSNIHVLPPAHALEFSNGQIKTYRYWDFPAPRREITLAAACEQFEHLLARAVEKQLIADVPVAAFLSGGLDSSTIVGQAVKYNSRLSTLSYRFGDGLDEGPFARAVAEKHGTQHVELFDEKVDIGELMKLMARVYDEPFADSSAIPTYLICKKAREYSKVVITGDAGDELLGGYVSRYRPMVIFSEHLRASRPRLMLERLMFGGLRKLLPRNPFLDDRANALKTRLAFDEVPSALDAIVSSIPREELAEFGLTRPDYRAAFPLEGGVNDAMKADILGYMPGDILVKTDRAAMANALELRAPFLDVELAEFLISLPGALKIDRQEDKIVMRRAFASTWPESLRKRGKQGFGAPVPQWLKLPDVKAMKAAYLAPGQPIYDHVPAGLVTRYRNTDCDRTWTLLTLGIWLDSIRPGRA